MIIAEFRYQKDADVLRSRCACAESAGIMSLTDWEKVLFCSAGRNFLHAEDTAGGIIQKVFLKNQSGNTDNEVFFS
jgi:hypothetical protein